MGHLMATGYVHMLLDGDQTFEQFVWSCARAFGALVLMRDDPADAPIPEKFEVGAHYTETIETARRDVARMEAMASVERIAHGERRIAETKVRYEKTTRERRAEVEKINGTLAAVEAWQPPTPDHDELKEFMLEQLRQSLPSSDRDYYADGLAALQTKGPMLVFIDDLADARERLSRAERSLAEEAERVNGRNEWLRQLRESLAP